jgi:hypothetical protein
MDHIELSQPDAPEITLEGLETGKFTIKDIPRDERDRLSKEAYERLPDEDAKEAWSMGWRSKGFYLGKTRDGEDKPYVDYKDYITKIKNNAPVQNERMRNLAQEKSVLEQKLEKMEAENRRTQELLRLQNQRAILKDESALNAELRAMEAEEFVDVNKYKTLSAQKADLEREKLALKQFEQAIPAAISHSLTPEEIAFTARNPWFKDDKVLARYARQVDSELRNENPDLSPAEHLLRVEEEVKSSFPEKFKASPPPYNPGVESARNAGNAGASKNYITFNELPEKEQLLVDQIIRRGGTSNYKTRSEFMALYNKDKNKK